MEPTLPFVGGGGDKAGSLLFLPNIVIVAVITGHSEQ